MSRQHGGLVDAAVIAFLIATTLSIFDTSFSDRSYLVAGLVPAVLLLVGALIARRFAEGGWWYALGALLAFAPMGAIVALRRPGPYFFPTFETMNRVLGESISAPSTLVSTVPPVDASGQVMLVPFLIGFLTVAPAAWLALGSRSALAPALPLVLGLAATIPLGVLVPDLLVVRGVVFSVVLVAWAAARARRGESLVSKQRGALAAAMTALLTVALTSAIVILLVPDRNEVDRVLLRGDGDSAVVSGAADTALPRRVGARKELLKAIGVPEGRLLRFAALDRYDGSAWVPAEESPGAGGTGTFKRIGHDVAALHEGPTVSVRIRIRPGYSSDWLPMLGELTSLDLDYTNGRSQLGDVRYNQSTASALVVGGVHPREDYTFTSVLTPEAFSRSDATQEPADDQLQPEGVFLDQYLRAFDREELRPIERVLLLARYLRLNGTARFTGSSSQAPVDLGLRLLGSKQMSGTPFQYSAVMALGAARLGVPARVVTGADPGRDGLVRHDDVTSWVELQFDDGTWRILDQQRYVGVHLVGEEAEGVTATGAAGFVRQQLELAAKGKDPEIRIPKGSSILLEPGTELHEQRAPWRIVLGVLGGFAGVMLGFLMCVPAVKWLRRRARRGAASWSAIYVNGWQEVLDAARDRGTAVPDTWSRVAQSVKLGAGTDLAREADAAVFAPVAPSRESGQEFWLRAQKLRRQLLAESEPRMRLWAQFNPGSLLAGWRRRRSTTRASGSGSAPSEGATSIPSRSHS